MTTPTREERIRKLAERLSQEPLPAAPPDPPKPKLPEKARPRKRHSLYLDTALLDAVDAALAQVQSDLAPLQINKSSFLEQLLRRGLADLEGVKAALKGE